MIIKRFDNNVAAVVAYGVTVLADVSTDLLQEHVAAFLPILDAVLLVA